MGSEMCIRDSHTPFNLRRDKILEPIMTKRGRRARRRRPRVIPEFSNTAIGIHHQFRDLSPGEIRARPRLPPPPANQGWESQASITEFSYFAQDWMSVSAFRAIRRARPELFELPIELSGSQDPQDCQCATSAMAVDVHRYGHWRTWSTTHPPLEVHELGEHNGTRYCAPVRLSNPGLVQTGTIPRSIVRQCARNQEMANFPPVPEPSQSCLLYTSPSPRDS